MKPMYDVRKQTQNLHSAAANFPYKGKEGETVCWDSICLSSKFALLLD